MHLPLASMVVVLRQTRRTPERQSAAGWKQRKAAAKQLLTDQPVLPHPALLAQVTALIVQRATIIRLNGLTCVSW